MAFKRAAGETMFAPECHEEVTRRGMLEPCEKVAVAVRIDPNEGSRYPVCARHVRGPMVPLAEIQRAGPDQRLGLDRP
jgi:hypothetical protein